MAEGEKLPGNLLTRRRHILYFLTHCLKYFMYFSNNNIMAKKIKIERASEI